MPEIETITDALRAAQVRGVLPLAMGSAELRGIGADVRARAVFSARATNATFLDSIKMVIDELAAGKTDHATARWYLAETLKELGYDSEAGGFPDAPGAVEPALAGTLQDLRSRTRLDLILKTQLALVRGRGQQMRGSAGERLRQFPAWELVRASARIAPRLWGGKHDGTPPRRGGDIDPRPRWIIAGGRPLESGRLVALKGDPVWGELGSSGNFDDALDVDYPPFAFNSGMRWVELPRAEVRKLGVRGPNGESIDEWLAMDHPTLVDTQSGIPAPQASVKNLDPAIRKAFEESAGIEIVESTATTPGNEDAVRASIEARRAAREARRAELARQATDRASAAYRERGEQP